MAAARTACPSGDREDEGEQQAEHEDRDRHADVGDDHRADVGGRVAPDGRDDAERRCRPMVAKISAKIVSSTVVGRRSTSSVADRARELERRSEVALAADRLR